MRAVLVFALTAIAVYAQSAISGKVIDPSGAAVVDAAITATERSSGLRMTTKSGPEGSYLLDHLGSGEFLVEAQAPGFGLSRVETVVVKKGERIPLELRLELGRVTSQVQITSAGGAQSVDEQSKASDTIDSQQISDREEYTLSEAIRTVPGIRVQQLGGPGAFVRVLSRGLRTQDTAVLVDGFRLRDAAAPQGEASSLIGDLLLTDIDRVEVLRGSGSSLYGTHATGGVINLITATGDPGFHGETGFEGGGLGFLRGMAKVSGAQFAQRLRYSLGANYLNVRDGIDGNDRTRNTVGQGLVQYRLTDNTDISGRILANDSSTQLNSTPSAIGQLLPSVIYHAVPYVNFIPSPDDPDNVRMSNYFTGLIALSHNWTPRLSSRLSYNAVTTSRDNRNGPGGVDFQPEFNTSDLFEGRLDTIQARVDLQLPANWITAGYEWEREGFNSLSTDTNPDPVFRANARLKIRQASSAIYAQDQIQLLSRRLQISLAGRFQNFQLNQPQFSDGTSVYQNVRISTPPNAYTGDASFAYFVASTSTKVRGHVGNGYRVPSLYERFGGSFFGGFSVYGDPLLQPERLLSVDGGIDQYLGSRTRVSATYFYTRIQQAIIFDFSGAIAPPTDPYGRFGGYRNTSGGLARGVEISVESNPIRSLILRSSYTYSNADERVPYFSTGTLRSPRISNHMFTATATQRFGRAFDATFDLFAASDYLMSLSSTTFSFDGPVKADAAFNYTRAVTDTASVRFFTRVENILNRTYYEEGFRTPKAWATAGVRFLF